MLPVYHTLFYFIFLGLIHEKTEIAFETTRMGHSPQNYVQNFRPNVQSLSFHVRFLSFHVFWVVYLNFNIIINSAWIFQKYRVRRKYENTNLR